MSQHGHAPRGSHQEACCRRASPRAIKTPHHGARVRRGGRGAKITAYSSCSVSARSTSASAARLGRESYPVAEIGWRVGSRRSAAPQGRPYTSVVLESDEALHGCGGGGFEQVMRSLDGTRLISSGVGQPDTPASRTGNSSGKMRGARERALAREVAHGDSLHRACRAARGCRSLAELGRATW